jgi:hypothetical protein
MPKDNPSRTLVLLPTGKDIGISKAENCFKVDAKSIELSGSIKVDTGTSGSAGIVSVGSGGTVVYNGLAKSNSIILATTQDLGSGTVYPSVVTGKGDGVFTLQHNFGSSLNVAYLIINPI